MQRIGNLNWENITYDHDISGLVRGLTDWGVIEGGTVVGNKLQPVQAVVPLVRSNGQKILAFFESDEVIDLPTSGDYKVYIEVDQSKIDFGANNPEDGTGIASIKTWPTLPSQNFLLLASVTAGQVKDERNLIPKIQSVATRTTTLEEKVSQAEEKVGKLEEAGTPSYLAVYWIVGSEYSEWDNMYKVAIPQDEYSKNGKECLFWTPDKKEFEACYLLNWKQFQSLGLLLGRQGNPMDGVTIEIRNVIPSGEKISTYKSGDIVYATGTILPAEIDESFKKIEVQLDKPISLNKGEKIALKIKRSSANYNSSNYYYLGYVDLENKGKVGLWEVVVIWGNGKQVKMNMMTPITSPWIESEFFLNKKINYQVKSITNEYFWFSNMYNEEERTVTIPASWRYKIKIRATGMSTFSFYIKQNNKKIKDLPGHSYNSWWVEYDGGTIDLEKWECKIVWRITQSSSWMNFYISFISELVEEKNSYVVEKISEIGTTEEFIFFGKYKDSWKLLDQSEYPRGTILEISATNSGETKSMDVPYPWVVILSAWTNYKRVSCNIDGITFIELYQQNSGSISQTLTIPVKGWEKVTVRKHESDWGASARFISL